MNEAKGPLAGIRIVELGGIGPVPFCAMLLSDLGADIVRIDRPPGFDGGAPIEPKFNLLNRGRRSAGIDLKKPEAAAAILQLVARADAVLEGFRPGTAERLGLGPAECLAANPRVVYGRMTGWGQDGPRASEPGHDINYIALTGALHAIGRKDEAPAIPLNLIGDFGGGSLYLALGVVSAILESRRSGQGQVVDAAMVDGAASLMTLIYGLTAAGYWTDERGANRLDSGAPFYNVYETRDGKHIGIGANETRFYRNAVKLLCLDEAALPDQHDKSGWPVIRERFAAAFRTRTRDEWVALAEGKEVCIAPILSLAEAPEDPHLKARGTFVEIDGVVQPAPAPRFSRTAGAIQRPPANPGEHTDEVLADWGLSADTIDALRSAGVIA
ncbi:CaiB/BaiF CoA-transferase family protein [Bosea sp. ASV33]|uniref:CoA transferase n=1 Tax=Bosea sp. ASV33 TaxID=2795106 RepID=UPI0018EA7A18